MHIKNNETNTEETIEILENENPDQANVYEHTVQRTDNDIVYTYWVEVRNGPDDVEVKGNKEVTIPKKNTTKPDENGIILKREAVWIKGDREFVKLSWNNPYYELNDGTKEYIAIVGVYSIQRAEVKEGKSIEDEDVIWEEIGTVKQPSNDLDKNITYIDDSISITDPENRTYYYKIVYKTTQEKESNKVDEYVLGAGSNKKLYGITLEIKEYDEINKKVTLKWNAPYYGDENGNVIETIPEWTYDMNRQKTDESWKNIFRGVDENNLVKTTGRKTNVIYYEYVDNIEFDIKKDITLFYRVTGHNQQISKDIPSNTVEQPVLAPSNYNLERPWLTATRIGETEQVKLEWYDPYEIDNNGERIYEDGWHYYPNDIKYKYYFDTENKSDKANQEFTPVTIIGNVEYEGDHKWSCIVEAKVIHSQTTVYVFCVKATNVDVDINNKFGDLLNSNEPEVPMDPTTSGSGKLTDITLTGEIGYTENNTDYIELTWNEPEYINDPSLKNVPGWTYEIWQRIDYKDNLVYRNGKVVAPPGTYTKLKLEDFVELYDGKIFYNVNEGEEIKCKAKVKASYLDIINFKSYTHYVVAVNNSDRMKAEDRGKPIDSNDDTQKFNISDNIRVSDIYLQSSLDENKEEVTLTWNEPWIEKQNGTLIGGEKVYRGTWKYDIYRIQDDDDSTMKKIEGYEGTTYIDKEATNKNKAVGTKYTYWVEGINELLGIKISNKIWEKYTSINGIKLEKVGEDEYTSDGVYCIKYFKWNEPYYNEERSYTWLEL